MELSSVDELTGARPLTPPPSPIHPPTHAHAHTGGAYCRVVLYVWVCRSGWGVSTVHELPAGLGARQGHLRGLRGRREGLVRQHMLPGGAGPDHPDLGR
jgi:hypothetical protein